MMNHRLELIDLQCRRPRPRLSGLGFTVVFVLLCVEYSSSSQYDREKWVNPDDMRHYDRASKTMITTNKNNREQVNEQNTDPTVKNVCEKDVEQENKLKEQLSSCENTLSKLENLPSSSTPQPESREEGCKRTTASESTAEYRYMRRFVNVLLQASGLVDSNVDAGETKRSTVTIDVTSEHLATLQRFGTAGGSVSLSELDDVLSHVVRSSDNTGFHLPLGWVERFTHAFAPKDALYRLLPYAVTLVTLSMLVVRRPVREMTVTFLVLVFTLSYQWTYDYMLKMAEVRQFAALSRHEDVPASCRSSPGRSLFEYMLRRLVGGPDSMEECRQYHAARMMEPTLEVTPTIVLSEMVSAMMLHPAAGLGAGLARFSHAILDGLPMFWNWAVLLLSFVLLAVIIVVVVAVLCGGRVRLPYIFSGLEVTGGQPARGATMEPRAAVQEIRNPAPAPTDPLVSALSSSTGGLVLMNMPVLERLMSSSRGDDREYVQRLAPPGGGDAVGTCCSQCKGGDTAEGARGDTDRRVVRRDDSDRRIATLDDLNEVKGGRDDSGRRIATTDTLNEVEVGSGDADRRITTTDALNVAMEGIGVSNRRIATTPALSEVEIGSGDADRRITSSDITQRSIKASQEVKRGSGDSGRRITSSDTTQQSNKSSQEVKGGSDDADRRITSSDITQQSNKSSQEVKGGSGDADRRIVTVNTTRESGAVLHDSARSGGGDCVGPTSEGDTNVARSSTSEPDVAGLDPRERSEFIDELRKILEETDDSPVTDERVIQAVQPDLVDTFENLLLECAGTEPASNVGRKVSSDSSDTSGDFVKL